MFPKETKVTYISQKWHSDATYSLRTSNLNISLLQYTCTLCFVDIYVLSPKELSTRKVFQGQNVGSVTLKEIVIQQPQKWIWRRTSFLVFVPSSAYDQFPILENYEKSRDILEIIIAMVTEICPRCKACNFSFAEPVSLVCSCSIELHRSYNFSIFVSNKCNL